MNYASLFEKMADIETGFGYNINRSTMSEVEAEQDRYAEVDGMGWLQWEARWVQSNDELTWDLE